MPEMEEDLAAWAFERAELDDKGPLTLMKRRTWKLDHPTAPHERHESDRQAQIGARPQLIEWWGRVCIFPQRERGKILTTRKKGQSWLGNGNDEEPRPQSHGQAWDWGVEPPWARGLKQGRHGGRASPKSPRSSFWSKRFRVKLILDMSKAYDRVEWTFLQGMMQKLGFHDKWIHLIMKCVTTVSYRINVNGEYTDQIFPRRGLRQGDPPIAISIHFVCGRPVSHASKCWKC